ncbi:hypothetical protein FGO68_gene17490 [Halteria grandinella]|uniref:Uncharacterized protein n=1 Tax=Halteria grandinella TaxID=5974 RepID=A0A8J8NN54_HALGN|nr:hypothetical protein FGO68_gene17490 [Halteria grandinella]
MKDSRVTPSASTTRKSLLFHSSRSKSKQHEEELPIQQYFNANKSSGLSHFVQKFKTVNGIPKSVKNEQAANVMASMKLNNYLKKAQTIIQQSRSSFSSQKGCQKDTNQQWSSHLLLKPQADFKTYRETQASQDLNPTPKSEKPRALSLHHQAKPKNYLATTNKGNIVKKSMFNSTHMQIDSDEDEYMPKYKQVMKEGKVNLRDNYFGNRKLKGQGAQKKDVNESISIIEDAIIEDAYFKTLEEQQHLQDSNQDYFKQYTITELLNSSNSKFAAKQSRNAIDQKSLSLCMMPTSISTHTKANFRQVEPKSSTRRSPSDEFSEQSQILFQYNSQLQETNHKEKQIKSNIKEAIMSSLGNVLQALYMDPNILDTTKKSESNNKQETSRQRNQRSSFNFTPRYFKPSENSSAQLTRRSVQLMQQQRKSTSTLSQLII